MYCVVGHGAMEAACTNLLEPGETVLVCENGLWGQRFADMCTRNGKYFLARKNAILQAVKYLAISKQLDLYTSCS